MAEFSAVVFLVSTVFFILIAICAILLPLYVRGIYLRLVAIHQLLKRAESDGVDRQQALAAQVQFLGTVAERHDDRECRRRQEELDSATPKLPDPASD